MCRIDNILVYPVLYYFTDIESPQITCPEENAITVFNIPVVTNKVLCHLQFGGNFTFGQKRITL